MSMSRALLSAALIVLTSTLLVSAVVNRYQYFSVIGPSWNGKVGAQTDFHRIDRWTGVHQVWECQDVDTKQVAQVPPPPRKPSDFSQENVDSVVQTGQYFIELSLWRTIFPHVDPQNLYVTKPVCGWETAR
jgi:hypothetical protein